METAVAVDGAAAGTAVVEEAEAVAAEVEVVSPVGAGAAALETAGAGSGVLNAVPVAGLAASAVAFVSAPEDGVDALVPAAVAGLESSATVAAVSEVLLSLPAGADFACGRTKTLLEVLLPPEAEATELAAADTGSAWAVTLSPAAEPSVASGATAAGSIWVSTAAAMTGTGVAAAVEDAGASEVVVWAVSSLESCAFAGALPESCDAGVSLAAVLPVSSAVVLVAA